MRKLILFGICIILLSSIAFGSDILLAHPTYPDDGATTFNAQWVAQPFIMNGSKYIDSLNISLGEVIGQNPTYPITIELRYVDSENKPTSSIVDGYSMSITSALADDLNVINISFVANVSRLLLNDSQNYSFVFKTQTLTGDRFKIGYNTGVTYPEGPAWKSADSGTTWTTGIVNAGNGIFFIIYGSEEIGIQNFTIIAEDILGNSMTNFSVWVDGSKYSTTSGTIITHLLSNDSNLYDVIIGGTNFYNQTYSNWNVSYPLTSTGSYQSILNITAQQSVSGDSISSFIIHSDFGSNSTTSGVVTLYTLFDSYNFTISSGGYLNSTITNENINSSIYYLNSSLYTTELNITAKSYKGATVEDFDILLSQGSYSETIASSNNMTQFGLINGTYSMTIMADGYAYQTKNITINTTYQAYEFILYTSNSLNISILNEVTGASILTDVSIRFSSDSEEWTNTTNSSYFYIDTLSVTDYAIKFSAEGYSDRTYQITIGNNTHQSITVYMAENTSSTIFTITDIDTSGALSDVLGSMYRFLGGTWSPVESKFSDITGKISFDYVEGAKYKFYFSKDGYEDYIFYLDPILYAEYDIQLGKSSTNLPENERVSLIYYPYVFYEGINNFTFLIQNPSGELISYGFNISYPGGSNYTTGSNAIGGQLNVVFNISGAVLYDTVKIEYWYETTIAGNHSFTAYYPIILNQTSKTFFQNDDYGLGLFERILMVTFFVLFVVGIASLIGRPIEGVALGLFVFGYFSYNGFIPLWAILPSMLMGVTFLALRS